MLQKNEVSALIPAVAAQMIAGIEKNLKKGNGKHTAPAPEVITRAAKIKGKGKDKVAAGFGATHYGENMAKAYCDGLGVAGQSWQDGIIYLLEHCTDVQREQAMSGAMVYSKKIAKEKGADFKVSALRKRVSEARRVFKAATIKGHADVVKTFKGKGSWHQKVAAMPKATTKGAKKGAKTPTATVAQALASVAAMAPGHTKNHEVPVNDVVALVKQLSTAKMLIVLDVIAFHLSQSPDLYEQGCGKQVMQFRDRQEAAVAKKKAA